MTAKKTIADPWMHRSAGMRCKTCIWAVMKVLSTLPDETGARLAKQSRIGRCRRHAPTMNGYPVIFEDDWCGDHKLDENKV